MVSIWTGTGQLNLELIPPLDVSGGGRFYCAMLCKAHYYSCRPLSVCLSVTLSVRYALMYYIETGNGYKHYHTFLDLVVPFLAYELIRRYKILREPSTGQ